METVQKRRGNPNFGASTKKQPTKTSDFDPNKRYQFQLTQTVENALPRDRDTGELVVNPYPPLFFIPSEGVAYDSAKDEVRRWRYVYGFNSIWVDEQTKPEPTKGQLESERNMIMFREGSLWVNGKDKAKLQALMAQDIFEGNENPLEQKNKVYRLVDNSLVMKKARDVSDEAYNAEKAVREASYEALEPLAMVFGIDTSNVQDEDDQEDVRTQIIVRAKAEPKAVLRELSNPINEIKFLVKGALDAGTLQVVENKLQYDTGTPIFEVKADGDVPEQVAKKVIAQDAIALKLYSQLQQ